MTDAPQIIIRPTFQLIAGVGTIDRSDPRCLERTRETFHTPVATREKRLICCCNCENIRERYQNSLGFGSAKTHMTSRLLTSPCLQRALRTARKAAVPTVRIATSQQRSIIMTRAAVAVVARGHANFEPTTTTFVGVNRSMIGYLIGAAALAAGTVLSNGNNSECCGIAGVVGTPHNNHDARYVDPFRELILLAMRTINVV